MNTWIRNHFIDTIVFLFVTIFMYGLWTIYCNNQLIRENQEILMRIEQYSNHLETTANHMENTEKFYRGVISELQQIKSIHIEAKLKPDEKEKETP